MLPSLLRSITTGSSVYTIFDGVVTVTLKFACAWAVKTISDTSAIIICFFIIDSYFKFVLSSSYSFEKSFLPLA